jgi:hypothetical protein
MRLPPRGTAAAPLWPPLHGAPLPMAGPAGMPMPLVIGRPASELWWTNPLPCVAIVAVVYASFMTFDFSRVVPHAYIPGWHYAWGGALLAALALGIAAVMALRRDAPQQLQMAFDVPKWLMAALFGCTVLAYVLWFQVLLENPGLMAEIAEGERSSIRDLTTTMPGITTMTQFGVAYVIAYGVMRGSRARAIARWEQAAFLAVFVLGAIRAFAWSERLAVIELVLCYLFARLAYARVMRERTWSLASAIPLVAPVLLYLAFTGTEYFRSWHFFVNEYDSVWEFSFERLMSYYATASNNGIGLLVEDRSWPQYTGRYIAEWLYQMPVVGEALMESVGDLQRPYFYFLSRFARPEFNNPSGMFPIVFDIGYAGSMLYFLIEGAVVGLLWDGWRRQSRVGVLFFPLAMLFLLELLRFNYFASSRFFASAVPLVVIWAASRPVFPQTPRPAPTPW